MEDLFNKAQRDSLNESIREHINKVNELKKSGNFSEIIEELDKKTDNKDKLDKLNKEISDKFIEINDMMNKFIFNSNLLNVNDDAIFDIKDNLQTLCLSVQNYIYLADGKINLNELTLKINVINQLLNNLIMVMSSQKEYIISKIKEEYFDMAKWLEKNFSINVVQVNEVKNNTQSSEKINNNVVENKNSEYIHNMTNNADISDKKQDEKNMYRYEVKCSDYAELSRIVKRINIEAYVEVFSIHENQTDTFIVSSPDAISDSLNQIYFNRTYYISQEKYDDLKKIYSCSVSKLMTDYNEIISDLNALRADNPGVLIKLKKDVNGAYQIESSKPINELKFNNQYTLGIDRDGYLVEKSHSIAKSGDNGKIECYPFVDSHIGKILISKLQNNQVNNIKTPEKTNESVSNNSRSEDSKVVTNVDDKNDNSKKQQEEASIGELLEIIERITKQQHDYESLNRKAMNTLYGHMQSMQKLINQQQQQIELLTKNLMTLQGNQIQNPTESMGKSL